MLLPIERPSTKEHMHGKQMGPTWYSSTTYARHGLLSQVDPGPIDRFQVSCPAHEDGSAAWQGTASLGAVPAISFANSCEAHPRESRCRPIHPISPQTSHVEVSGEPSGIPVGGETDNGAPGARVRACVRGSRDDVVQQRAIRLRPRIGRYGTPGPHGSPAWFGELDGRCLLADG